MADKKYIIKPGERVRVEINRKSKLQSPKSENPIRRGSIKLRRENPYLARRLSGNFINFYDLGYYAVDDYFETFDTLFQPAVAPPAEDSDALTWTVEPEDYEAFFEELETEIFATELEDFPTGFFKIYKGNPNFERSVTVAFPRTGDPDFESELLDLTEWENGGLKLSPAQAASLVIKPLPEMFNSLELDLGSMTDLKATLTRDYDADGVSFTPSNKMDVFLFPTPIYHFSNATYSNGLMVGIDFSDYRYHTDVLNAQLQLLPRDVVLGELLELNDDIGGLDTYQAHWRYAQLSKQFPDSRATRRKREVDAVSDPTVYIRTTETFDPADYPFADIYEELAPNNTSDKTSLVFGSNFGSIVEDYGRLKAVIRKNNIWYYIWNTA